MLCMYTNPYEIDNDMPLLIMKTTNVTQNAQLT